MSNLNVVHVSATPLVGAPAKLAAAQRRLGYRAVSVALSDYPSKGPLFGKFTDDMFLWGGELQVQQTIEDFFREAHIIHVHNDIPADKVIWIAKNSRKPAFAYQVHSPLREGPLYIDRHNAIELPFRARLVVGQYQPRHYPDYIPVPNIVLDAPTINLRKPNEKLRVLFSPTHAREGRWNSKYSLALEKAVGALVSLGKIESVRFDNPVHPNILMAVRRTCHVTIDEIVTGAFHQVSIEGLCAGNIVINRADYFSKSMLSYCANTSELPPFQYADEKCIGEVLLQLADDPLKTEDMQKKSFNYFKNYMQTEKLVRNVTNVYDKIL